MAFLRICLLPKRFKGYLDRTHNSLARSQGFKRAVPFCLRIAVYGGIARLKTQRIVALAHHLPFDEMVQHLFVKPDLQLLTELRVDYANRCNTVLIGLHVVIVADLRTARPAAA